MVTTVASLPADRATLQQRLAEAEHKVASLQHQIVEQRDVIAELERKGCSTDHPKYLLAGLELLQASHRENRNRLFNELGRISGS